MLRNTWLALIATVATPHVAAAQYIGGNAPPPPPPPAVGLNETPEAALARNIRVLAGSPRDYEALLGAGRAALALGDAQAAAGFFGRAEEVHPTSWAPKVGQGAALVQLLEAPAALRAFADAQRLGATQAVVALERGLAFDLIGDQGRAQSDYRAVLAGPDQHEARRRLALSVAISGRKAEALSILDPLLARRDPAALRIRALVLALTGDAAGARAAVGAAMPGMAESMDPFLRRLPGLQARDKAAAVHFGTLPGSDSPSSPYGTYAEASDGQAADRLADIEQLLRVPPASSGPPPAAPPPTMPVATGATTTVPLAAPGTNPRAAAPAPSRLWLQIASGEDQSALANQFRRLKSRNSDLLEGISGYVAQESTRSRLLIGPFKSANDARIFAEDLQTARVDAFPWTSAQGQTVRKLP